MDVADILPINASTLLSGAIVELRSSQILHLNFKTNITTGYQQLLINAEQVQNAGLLLPLNLKKNLQNYTGEYKQDENPNQMKGIGGVTTFKFQPILQDNMGSLTQKLEFIYGRPQQLKIGEETFKINVEVKID